MKIYIIIIIIIIIRLGIIAHGDYCDASSSYVTKIQNFSEDEDTLCQFVETVSATGGGDADECYELVLREAVTKFKWTQGSVRSLVMIGDSNPHGPKYPLNRPVLSRIVNFEQRVEIVF